MTENKSGVFGIDLGTTYSSIAYIDQSGKPIVVRSAVQGGDTTPSVVLFESEANTVVGATAKESAELYPDQVVSLVKREIGNSDFSREFFGQVYSAPAISAFILKALVQDAEMETGRKVDKVVITVPAYFGTLEKAATRQAGEIAGLDVVGIVSEPLAAAIAYGVATEPGERNLLVYDLGGGTFDVTVIRLTDDSIDNVAVRGDHKLGGADWDAVLFEHLAQRAMEQLGNDSLLEDAHFVQELWGKTEELKKHLSQSESRPVLVRAEGGTAKVTVTRSEFESRTAHLVQATVDITQKVLADAERESPGITAKIDDVLLVGGSSLMPAIAAALQREFGWNPTLSDPHLAVAKGAALYAAGAMTRRTADECGPQKREDVDGDFVDISKADTPTEAEMEAAAEEVAAQVGVDSQILLSIAKKASIRNRLPMAIGIETVDETMPGWREMNPVPTCVSHAISAQAKLPYDAAALGEVFTAGTVSDRQEVIRIAIYEQASPEPSRDISSNRYLAAGEITGLASYNLPAGSPIQIYFYVSNEGHVTLRAVESTSGKELEVKARIALLSEAELEKAKATFNGITVGM